MPRTRPRSSPSNVVLIGLATAAIVAVAVWLAVSRRSDSPVADHPVAPAGMSHVHGLGLTEAGDLYAGTHYGVFRVTSDGKAEQIGAVRDYMGFTVINSQQFLASGHPAMGEKAPGLLGLLSSVNSGKDWATLSLAGQADFHALDANEQVVYGASGGVLMKSTDRRQWQTLAKLELYDVAVPPRGADELLATTASGLAHSADGGTTFTPVAKAPALVLIDWADEQTVVGVAADGVVHVSVDRGATWERRGTAGGPPHALTADKSAIFVATDAGISGSADGGATFTQRYSER